MVQKIEYYDEEKTIVRAKSDYYPNGTLKSRVEFYQGTNQASAVYIGGETGHGTVGEFYENGNKMAEYTVQCSGWSSAELYGAHRFNCLPPTTKFGKLDGQYILYHPNGHVAFTGRGKEGRLDGHCTEYYDNKVERVTFVFNEGKVVDDLYTIHRENGDPKEVIEYKNGRANGLYKSFHKSGEASEITQCQDGQKVGPYTKYDRKGRKIHDGVYQNGDRVIVNRYNGFKEKDR